MAIWGVFENETCVFTCNFTVCLFAEVAEELGRECQTQSTSNKWTMDFCGGHYQDLAISKMPIFFLDCWVFQICCSYSFDRLSPFEWENPTPWVESDEVENCCTLHNCFWHNWGSLMQQGSDICPRYFCATKQINQTKTVCQITLCHFFSKNIRISLFD